MFNNEQCLLIRYLLLLPGIIKEYVPQALYET